MNFFDKGNPRKICFSDLDDNLKAKIQLGTGTGTMDLSAYFKKIDKFSSANLNKALYDDIYNTKSKVLKNETDIEKLNTSKAEKGDVELCRKNAVKIEAEDLARSVLNLIASGSGGGGGGISEQIVNDLYQQIATLATNKANAIALNDYRLKANPINKQDLEQELVQSLDAVGSVADIVSNKADKTQLQEYRRKDTSILMTDLEPTLAQKITDALKATLETELYVKEYSEQTRQKIWEEIIKVYGSLGTLIYEIQLAVVTMYPRPGDTGEFTIPDVINYIWLSFRKNSTKIVEADLDNLLKTKINSISSIAESVETINQSITSITESLSAINNNITLLKADMTTVKQDIVSLKDSKYIILGEFAYGSAETEFKKEKKIAGIIYDLENKLEWTLNFEGTEYTSSELVYGTFKDKLLIDLKSRRQYVFDSTNYILIDEGKITKKINETITKTPTVLNLSEIFGCYINSSTVDVSIYTSNVAQPQTIFTEEKNIMVLRNSLNDLIISLAAEDTRESLNVIIVLKK